MKFIDSKLTVIAAVLALTAGMAFAEDEAAAGHNHRHGVFMGEHGLGLPLHELNLTQDQHAQIKQIFQNEKPTIKPLMQQEFQARQQLIQLVTSGAFDQAKASAIAAQESQTHLQLEVEHAKIAAEIYQLLSTDQKAKVADMIAKHQQHMQEHFEGQERAAPASE